MRIAVYKSERTLILHGDEVLRFPIALGKCPIGAKEREGDLKTPEGSYVISTKNARSKYHKSLGIAYPSARDAHRAFARGEIDQATRDAIVNAGGRPPWDTPLGGFIMIHGGGTEGDWTAGCIALQNAHMDTLFERVQIGDSIDIYE